MAEHIDNSSPTMFHSYGRPLRKLRIQLLDSCNYRCTYCMPEKPIFSKASTWLGAKELTRIASELVRRGVDELRLTGGEPLLRKDFIEVAQQLSTLPWRKLGLTTNGERLSEILPDIKKYTHIDSLNISIDSLDPVNFKKITQRGHLEKVLEGLHMALAMDFPVKVNVVVMRGVNDHELDHFVEFSAHTGVTVRFLELMRIGPNNEDFSSKLVPSAELIQRLNQRTRWRPVVVPKDNTSFEYISTEGAHVGFIASETQSFCETCSRLRLTAQGELRPCLFKNEGVSLVGKTGTELDSILSAIALKKPLERITSIPQAMYAIGG